eukprot:g360.t1
MPTLAQPLRPTAYVLRIAPDLDACTYTWDVDIAVEVDDGADTDAITLHYVPTAPEADVRAFWSPGETVSTPREASGDFAHIGIDACVTDDDPSGKTSATGITYSGDEQTVTFVFPPGTISACRAGHLLLSSRGVLNDSLAGFYRSSYSDSFTGEQKYMGVTQFEATDARRAFPCIDEPAVKATFEVTLVVAA